jgi:hypothetical protein
MTSAGEPINLPLARNRPAGSLMTMTGCDEETLR